MKASDILHRLTQAVRQLPSSRRNVAAAAVVATVMGAVAGLAWPRLTGGGHEGVSSFPRAILDNGVGPVPNREAKGGLSHGAGDSIGAEALAPASGPPAPEQQATAETAAPAATTGATVTADAPQPTDSPPPAETPAVPKIPPAKVAATGAVAEQSQATSASGAPTSAQAPISDNPLDRLARGGSVQTPPAAQPASPPQAPPPGQVPPPSDGERKLAAIAGPPQQPEAPSYPPADPREVAAALGPMLARQPGAEDIEALKEAVRLVQKEDFDGARAAYNKISGKTVRKLAYWYYLRSSNANVRPNEIAAFRNANPHWPGRDTLDERAEKSLILHMASWQETFDFFHNRKPTTGAGKAALGAALIAKGEKEQGVRLVREAWRQHVLDDELEAKLLERFSGILTEADHKNRADFLSFKSKRSKVAVVLRHQQPAAKPGRQTPGKPLTPGKTLGAQLSTARSPARLLARINLLRKQDKHQEAWALLRASPKDAGGSGADWWPERRLQARNALNRGQAKIAYAIVLGHGPLEAEMQAEAGFMAGWIALRFLNDPATARQHLIGATHAGGLPKDLARSYYWLARAEIVLAKKADAQAHFVEASRHQHTFYGQLARTALTAIGAGPKSPRISLRAPARPTAEDIRAFQDLDSMEAMLIAQKAGLDGLVPLFLYDMARHIDSPGLLTLVAEFGQKVAHQNVNVRFAKVGLNRGFPLEHYAYPAALPQFRPLIDNSRMDRALLHALTRQESEFNTQIVSSANARGLMQLLPSTAKQMCQVYGVRYDAGKLTGDPAYNVSLGSAYLYKVLDEYNGSYIMALASYNAGPGRVREWIGMFGDPRDPKVDPIDWAERIPFTETRDYVHKIMESIQLYRARLGGRDGPLMLVDDLYRGRPAAGAPAH